MIWGGIMYTKIEEAMLFAFKANKGKKVKINNVDKTFDNIAVYSLMKDICEAEDVLVASLLHDVINDTEYGKYVQKYQIIQDDNYEYQVYVSVQTTLQEDGLEELVDRIDKLIGLMMCPILE